MDIKDFKLKNASFQGIIGVAQTDITPPTGIYSRNWGAALHDVAEGIHQPLMLTCTTFQSAAKETPLVLIGADLGWWKSAADEWALRSQLLKALDLAPSQLMFCLSHTHAGPALSRDEATQPGGELIDGYLQTILEHAIQAVRQALSNAVPATLTWHYGKCGLATNRDLAQPERQRYIVGFNPDEEADDTLLVGRITDTHERILGTIVNYACHPTTLAWENRLISPDYIGAMREIVEGQTGASCLFLQGASGELAPAAQYVGDTALAETYGRQLGYAVLATLEAMLPAQTQLSFTGVVESGGALAIWSPSVYTPSTVLAVEMVEVELHLKPLPPLAEIEQQWRECEDHVLKERLRRKCGIRKALGDGQEARVGLWVWRLGDALLIGQPNETYSIFQRELRREFSAQAVGVMNVVNGHIGYLAPAELYNHDIYSVSQTPFAAGSLELLTEKTMAIVKELMTKKHA
ncbi:neutral/alkaline non-lysosomal ceramidase N-terminal domain-containing protein [Chitinophaga sp. MM2321]|uniref:neutral/alkaline non-lysosomal ceramidase N-terminal domain-containing protein n=1 Tax=Chitinophaga sp. MM2321 TaxID=3137178 RepID=UPI0032D575FC